MRGVYVLEGHVEEEWVLLLLHLLVVECSVSNYDIWSS